MEELKLVFIGVIIGGVVVYYGVEHNKDSSSFSHNITTKEVICLKESNTFLLKEKKSQEKEDVEVENKEKIEESVPIKTPDELYEEQEKSIAESEKDKEEIVPVDRSIIPLELEESELNVQNFSSLDIEEDENIVSLELHLAESKVSSTDDTSDIEEYIPPLKLEVLNEETEIKEVIAEELKNLEEYGDISSISTESVIPK